MRELVVVTSRQEDAAQSGLVDAGNGKGGKPHFLEYPDSNLCSHK
jgi:hypothetical protein